MNQQVSELIDNFLSAFNTEYSRLLINPDKQKEIEEWLLGYHSSVDIYRISHPEDVSAIVSSVFGSIPVRSFVMNVATGLSFYYSAETEGYHTVSSMIADMIISSGIKDDDDKIYSVVPIGIKDELQVSGDITSFIYSNQWYSTIILIALHLDKTNFYNNLLKTE